MHFYVKVCYSILQLNVYGVVTVFYFNWIPILCFSVLGTELHLISAIAQ